MSENKWEIFPRQAGASRHAALRHRASVGLSQEADVCFTGASLLARRSTRRIRRPKSASVGGGAPQNRRASLLAPVARGVLEIRHAAGQATGVGSRGGDRVLPWRLPFLVAIPVHGRA
ncbi:hypothetical protein ABZT49_33890 [Methylobacterium sp. EM32]|uniref:hypothetical protein n=1 Tax=Methylobacterium sp. EM32 TaxID=3163481 RepID=UPI0033AB6A1B